jgi:E3 ubiquitin-protein ligase RGLG
VDQFHSVEEVQRALRTAGLESSNLIIGVDFTKSNVWTGAKTFGNKCLHSVERGKLNPYQAAISMLGETLSAFDDDGLVSLTTIHWLTHLDTRVWFWRFKYQR